MENKRLHARWTTMIGCVPRPSTTRVSFCASYHGGDGGSLYQTDGKPCLMRSTENFPVASMQTTPSMCGYAVKLVSPSAARFQMMMTDRAFVDYFNVFLQLPIFARRMCYRYTNKTFLLDPRIVSVKITAKTKLIMEWLRVVRFPVFSKTHLFLEYCLCNHLRQVMCQMQLPCGIHDKIENLNEWRMILDHTIGYVIGMRQFRQSMRNTAGESLYECWIDLQRFRRLDTDDKRRNVLYWHIRERYMMANSGAKLKMSLVPEDLLQKEQISKQLHLSYIENDFHIDNPDAFQSLENCVLSCLKNYWLPRHIVFLLAARPGEGVLEEMFTEKQQEQLKKTMARISDMFSETPKTSNIDILHLPEHKVFLIGSPYTTDTGTIMLTEFVTIVDGRLNLRHKTQEETFDQIDLMSIRFPNLKMKKSQERVVVIPVEGTLEWCGEEPQNPNEFLAKQVGEIVPLEVLEEIASSFNPRVCLIPKMIKGDSIGEKEGHTGESITEIVDTRSCVSESIPDIRDNNEKKAARTPIKTPTKSGSSTPQRLVARVKTKAAKKAVVKCAAPVKPRPNDFISLATGHHLGISNSEYDCIHDMNIARNEALQTLYNVIHGNLAKIADTNELSASSYDDETGTNRWTLCSMISDNCHLSQSSISLLADFDNSDIIDYRKESLLRCKPPKLYHSADDVTMTLPIRHYIYGGDIVTEITETQEKYKKLSIQLASDVLAGGPFIEYCQNNDKWDTMNLLKFWQALMEFRNYMHEDVKDTRISQGKAFGIVELYLLPDSEYRAPFDDSMSTALRNALLCEIESKVFNQAELICWETIHPVIRDFRRIDHRDFMMQACVKIMTCPKEGHKPPKGSQRRKSVNIYQLPDDERFKISMSPASSTKPSSDSHLCLQCNETTTETGESGQSTILSSKLLMDENDPSLDICEDTVTVDSASVSSAGQLDGQLFVGQMSLDDQKSVSSNMIQGRWTGAQTSMIVSHDKVEAEHDFNVLQASTVSRDANNVSAAKQSTSGTSKQLLYYCSERDVSHQQNMVDDRPKVKASDDLGQRDDPNNESSLKLDSSDQTRLPDGESNLQETGLVHVSQQFPTDNAASSDQDHVENIPNQATENDNDTIEWAEQNEDTQDRSDEIGNINWSSLPTGQAKATNTSRSRQSITPRTVASRGAVRSHISGPHLAYSHVSRGGPSRMSSFGGSRMSSTGTACSVMSSYDTVYTPDNAQSRLLGVDSDCSHMSQAGRLHMKSYNTSAVQSTDTPGRETTSAVTIHGRRARHRDETQSSHQLRARRNTLTIDFRRERAHSIAHSVTNNKTRPNGTQDPASIISLQTQRTSQEIFDQLSLIDVGSAKQQDDVDNEETEEDTSELTNDHKIWAMELAINCAVNHHMEDYLSLEDYLSIKKSDLGSMDKALMDFISQEHEFLQHKLDQQKMRAGGLPWCEVIKHRDPIDAILNRKPFIDIVNVNICKQSMYKRIHVPTSALKTPPGIGVSVAHVGSKSTSSNTDSLDFNRTPRSRQSPNLKAKSSVRLTRPSSLAACMNDERHLDAFTKFLTKNHALTPLRFLLAVQEMKELSNARSQLKMTNKISKNFLSKRCNPTIRLDCKDDIIRLAPTMKNISPAIVVTAQQSVYRSLDRKWFGRYQAMFEDDENVSSATPESESTSTASTVNRFTTSVPWFMEGRGSLHQETSSRGNWRRFCQQMTDFSKGMGNRQIVKLFFVYLRNEIKKLSQEHGMFPINNSRSKKKTSAAVNQPTEKKSQDHGIFPDISVQINNKMIILNKVIQDVEFWIEVKKFKYLYRCISQEKKVRGQVMWPADEKNLHAKGLAIIQCFLQSDVAPRIRINIPYELAHSTITSFETKFPLHGHFHEAYMFVFPFVLQYWCRFVNAWNPLHLRRKERIDLYWEKVAELGKTRVNPSPHDSQILPNHLDSELVRKRADEARMEFRERSGLILYYTLNPLAMRHNYQRRMTPSRAPSISQTGSVMPISTDQSVIGRRMSQFSQRRLGVLRERDPSARSGMSKLSMKLPSIATTTEESDSVSCRRPTVLGLPPRNESSSRLKMGDFTSPFGSGGRKGGFTKIIDGKPMPSYLSQERMSRIGHHFMNPMTRRLSATTNLSEDSFKIVNKCSSDFFKFNPSAPEPVKGKAFKSYAKVRKLHQKQSLSDMVMAIAIRRGSETQLPRVVVPP